MLTSADLREHGTQRERRPACHAFVRVGMSGKEPPDMLTKTRAWHSRPTFLGHYWRAAFLDVCLGDQR